ncbi:MAG: hypothetical protein ACLSCR_05700 [Akkermansia sp.]
MAIKLIANYSKRLGLPGYSSHQFEVSIETEIPHTSELASETERLYGSFRLPSMLKSSKSDSSQTNITAHRLHKGQFRGFLLTDDIHIIRETNTACKRS